MYPVEVQLFFQYADDPDAGYPWGLPRPSQDKVLTSRRIHELCGPAGQHRPVQPGRLHSSTRIAYVSIGKQLFNALKRCVCMGMFFFVTDRTTLTHGQGEVKIG